MASTRLAGCIEDVKLNNVAVGLWNFEDEENLEDKGCKAR